MITSDMVNDVEFFVNYNRKIKAVRRLPTNDKVVFGVILSEMDICRVYIFLCSEFVWFLNKIERFFCF